MTSSRPQPHVSTIILRRQSRSACAQLRAFATLVSGSVVFLALEQVARYILAAPEPLIVGFSVLPQPLEPHRAQLGVAHEKCLRG
jgi:hypothetical protein